MRAFARTVALAAAALLSLPAAAADFSFPSARATDHAALWQAVMTHFHGPYDRSQRCWVGVSDGTRLCMRPHRLEVAVEGGGNRYHLATGGRPVDGGDCHGCSGAMTLLVLADDGPDLRLVARTPYHVEIGSWGSPPPEESLTLHRLAADAHGWAIRDGFMAQGVLTGWVSVWGVVDGAVVLLGDVPTTVDTCGFDPDDCAEHDHVVDFVPAPRRFFDLRLTSAPGMAPLAAGAEIVIPFDEAAMTYVVPKALEEMVQ